MTPICHTLLFRRAGAGGNQPGGRRSDLTCGEAVAAGVALQLLLAVLAVEVILAGRAQVHCKREREERPSDRAPPEPNRRGSRTRTELAGGGSGGGVDRGGGRSCLDATEDGLAAVSAVSSAAGCLRGLLPVVVEGDQLPLKSGKKKEETVRLQNK